MHRIDLLSLEWIYLVIAQLKSVLNDSVIHGSDKEWKMIQAKNASN